LSYAPMYCVDLNLYSMIGTVPANPTPLLPSRFAAQYG